MDRYRFLKDLDPTAKVDFNGTLYHTLHQFFGAARH